MIERFFRPFFGGVALDPSLATSSRTFDEYFRSFSAGDAALPAAGMQAIPDQLAAMLPDGTVQLGQWVTHVEPHEVHISDGSRVRAEVVVVATDGHDAAQLTSVEEPKFCASTTVWFAADHAPIDEPVIVVSGARSDPAQSMAVVSAAAPSYAPPGAALIAASAAGRTGVDLTEAVRAQFRRWFGRVVESWRHLRTDDIPRALPDQSPPLRPKQSVRLANGVYVCGDHRDTGSVQGALFSGRRTAALVASGS